MSVMDAIALAVGAAAVAEDLWRRRISNWISGLALAGGLFCHLGETGWRGGLVALGGVGVGFTVFLPFYLLGGMGGGDLKLMAGFGSMLGPASVLRAAWITALAGGAMAVVWLVAFRLARLARRRGWVSAAGPEPVASSIPYAPAIVLGAWMAGLGWFARG